MARAEPIKPVLPSSGWPRPWRRGVLSDRTPERLRAPTEANLRTADTNGAPDLEAGRPHDEVRRRLQGARAEEAADQGYTIIVNIGDQMSDLDGGFAERTYKLPNPFYFIP